VGRVLKARHRREDMKAFLSAVIVSAVLAVGAAYVLNTKQQSSAQAFATSGARVGDPGHNLVGVN
jgi:hypothetical protein